MPVFVGQAIVFCGLPAMSGNEKSCPSTRNTDFSLSLSRTTDDRFLSSVDPHVCGAGRFFNGVKRTGIPVVNRAENPCRVGLWPAVGAKRVVLAHGVFEGVFEGVQAAKPPANSHPEGETAEQLKVVATTRDKRD